MKTLLALLFAVGCAAPATDAALSAPLALDAAPMCEKVFTPGEGVPMAAVSDWARRWSEATGCDVRVGSGGIPMTLVDAIPETNGDPSPRGVTHWKGGEAASIELAASSYGDDTIGHEMGHALGSRDHEGAGILRAKAKMRIPLIDTAALTAVCAALPCTTFAPEMP